MYQTKDSGKRVEFETGMVRDTQEGKPRFDLLLPKGVPYANQMLTRLAQLMERGASKYQERNWEKARTQQELDRYYASALRHLMQWVNGESDEDHAAAVMFNIMAGEYVKYRMRPSLVNGEIHKPDGITLLSEPDMCETLGQHVCSRHPLGFPTAYAGLGGR